MDLLRGRRKGMRIFSEREMASIKYLLDLLHDGWMPELTRGNETMERYTREVLHSALVEDFVRDIIHG